MTRLGGSDADVPTLPRTGVAPYKAQMVGMRDGNGRMPIHIASFKGIDAITQLLLKHGADPSAKDGAGNDGVVLAERSGRRRCVTPPPVTVVRTM